jgi:hypothetical protein
MHEREVKEVYISKLAHPEVRKLLLPFQDLDLQPLQQKAVDLAYGLGLLKGGGSSNTKPNHQNPNRRQCGRCMGYYDVTKGIRCKCPAQQGRPTGGRDTSSGGRDSSSGRRPSNTRVQEAAFVEQLLEETEEQRPFSDDEASYCQEEDAVTAPEETVF